MRLEPEYVQELAISMSFKDNAMIASPIDA